MSNNYFQGTVENPYHLSIGAVVQNKEGEVCVHYFEKFSHKAAGDFEDFYLVMRETIEPNETIEQALARGLLEEFGMKASLRRYLGSIVSNFSKNDKTFEKTTLYFLCDFISMDESKRGGDIEATSEIKWLTASYLIEKMKEQRVRLKRADMDESSILERL